MIASNIAAFSNTAGRFHRNIVTIPQVADSDELNPYTMLTRSQARRKSGEMQMAASTPPMHAGGRIFITNGTLKSSRRSIQCHGMKQETMRQLKELQEASRTKIASPTVIKSNPVFQYAADENVSGLVSGKGRSREEDMKQAILELAQLGEHYMGKRGTKTKNKRTDGAVTKVPNLRALHKKTGTRRSAMGPVKSPLSTKDVNHYVKQMNAVDVHY